MRSFKSWIVIVWCLHVFWVDAIHGQDWPQWGGDSSRNHTSNGNNIPTDWNVGVFDRKTGKWNNDKAKNIKWVARLGSQSYSNAVVADGRVYVGTNNGGGYLHRYPSNVDLGCVLCFRESDGKFLWQYSSTKLPTGRVHDWPFQGIVSVPLVQEERLWFVNNRGEVICADTDGYYDDADDGPEQSIHATTDKHDADVIWKFDMMKELGVRQHNLATCAITAWQDTLFVCTSNGVDESHINIPAPHAPSFIALDKDTGRVLWTDNSPGMNILHGQWSAPAVAELGSVPQVIFGGGDGWVYSFRADRWRNGKPELLWKFDANPKDSEWILGGRGTRNNLVAIPVIHDGRVYVVVGQDPEHGEGDGHLWCLDPTKRGDVSAELVIDPAGKPLPHFRLHAAAEWARVLFVSGQDKPWDGVDENDLSATLRERFRRAGFELPNEVSIENTGEFRFLTAEIDGRARRFRLKASTWRYSNKPRHNLAVDFETHARVVANPNSAVVWHYDHVDRNDDGKIDFEEQFHRGIGSVAIKNNLLFVADLSGLVHCLDATTGKPHWTCDLLAPCWGSPLIVGDHVYIGDEDGDMAIFQLSADWTKSARQTEVETRGPTYLSFIEPLHEIPMGNSIYSTPIVANNVLYVTTKTHLFAIATSPEQEK